MEAVSTAMDKKTMIHVAAEIIIVGGVTFWLNGKINGQLDTIANLQKENADLKARLERIEQFLAQATGGAAPSGPPPARSPAGPPPAGPPHGRKKSRKQPPPPGPGTQSEEEEVMSSSDEEIEI